MAMISFSGHKDGEVVWGLAVKGSNHLYVEWAVSRCTVGKGEIHGRV